MPPSTVPPTFAEQDLDYYLRMIRGDFAELEATHALRVSPGPSQKNIVILLDRTSLGPADVLGARLQRHIMTARDHTQAVILIHQAARLAMADSEVLQ